jgi:hypothetical protein
MTLLGSSMINRVCAACGAWGWNKWSCGGKQRRDARRKRHLARNRRQARRRERRVISRRRLDSCWKRASASRQAHAMQKLWLVSARPTLGDEKLRHSAGMKKHGNL